MSYHLRYRGLPRELRDVIYEYLLCPPAGVVFEEAQWYTVERSIVCSSKIPINIFLANREMNEEATAALFAKNIFQFHLSDEILILRFLRSLPPKVLRRIQYVGLPIPNLRSSTPILLNFIMQEMYISSLALNIVSSWTSSNDFRIFPIPMLAVEILRGMLMSNGTILRKLQLRSSFIRLYRKGKGEQREVFVDALVKHSLQVTELLSKQSLPSASDCRIPFVGRTPGSVTSDVEIVDGPWEPLLAITFRRYPHNAASPGTSTEMMRADVMSKLDTYWKSISQRDAGSGPGD
ncbi:hypothetical protein NA57DRAFT_77242 [Rhizodiscina lignyota]|uniref:Uncharacterized protein n=1 Tax=Rhizodiscina lignyota TaxID=1504668 RepID=A0A9P4IED4_9PEZI|nr:hypothetical protein NA57DRAFT_77242 [Rhizodiscina lignyota]